MARRRYRAGSGKSHQGRRTTMAQPLSSIIRDLVKSSRSIAHSDDFEGHKLIQINSRQLFLLDLNILYILMSCVARPHQTPVGTASNFLQCKWVSCSKSYWQGYDLAWYKDMEARCFPQPNLWLARCASRSWAALRKFVVLSTQASKQQQQASSKQASQPASKPASQQASKQQAAASSSNKQQAAGKQASRQAGKQQQGKQQQASSNQRLPPWMNEQI